jgi:hypothetical protein
MRRQKGAQMALVESKNLPGIARGTLALLVGLSLAAVSGEAWARSPFVYSGEPIHPACIHALTMNQGDSVPVTTAVSLEGCATSARSRSKVRYKRDITLFEDDALLGGGSFGYREMTQLDNGIYALVILRILPDGEERVSLAAVKIVARPMIRHGQVVNLQMLELLGELWIPDMEMLSFRSVGNKVHFVAGAGPKKVERNVDLTRLGKLRK